MPFQFGTSKFIVTVTITVANTGVQNFWGGPVIGGQWIVDAISFQKISGSYCPIHDTKEKRKIGGGHTILESDKTVQSNESKFVYHPCAFPEIKESARLWISNGHSSVTLETFDDEHH